ncbi:hypothetical protein [Ferroplasma sp.]|uniref:hypothetical protein n=1 Tax=Ferroplasma sp. TaxID=2591003 RepID=UPI00261E9A2E|nr:hypothetical protein [Ferroplasma sp.]
MMEYLKKMWNVLYNIFMYENEGEGRQEKGINVQYLLERKITIIARGGNTYAV